jgi:hypothetical protein
MDSTKGGFIIVGFLAIILAIAFITSLGDITNAQTKYQQVMNESFTGSNNSNVSLAHTNITEFSQIRNSTGANFSMCTVGGLKCYLNYSPEGKITLAGLNNGTYYADYNYSDATYIQDSKARGFVPLIVLMFAIGILAVVLYIFYPKIKQNFNW